MITAMCDRATIHCLNGVVDGHTEAHRALEYPVSEFSHVRVGVDVEAAASPRHRKPTAADSLFFFFSNPRIVILSSH